MGYIKLHMEPIKRTIIKNVTQTILQINANFVQSILTLVTICCNSTKARYNGEEQPIVKVTQRDIIISLQRSCLPFKAFKRIYGTTQPKKIDTKLNIRDSGGNALRYRGTYLLPMQLMGKKIMKCRLPLRIRIEKDY